MLTFSRDLLAWGPLISFCRLGRHWGIYFAATFLGLSSAELKPWGPFSAVIEVIRRVTSSVLSGLGICKMVSQRYGGCNSASDICALGELQMSPESSTQLFLCNTNSRLHQPGLTKRGYIGLIYSNSITSQKLIIHRVTTGYFWSV